MPIGGSQLPEGGWLRGRQTPTKSTSQFGNPATFTAAADTQASDYDSIMQQYKDLATKFAQNPITANQVQYQPITPQLAPYQQSADVTKSLSDLSGLADTGGYTPQDIQNIRERDISPIRSIYANDQAQLERSRRLSGGYSPSFNATIGQISRDEAQKISDVTTAANAGIAQNQAANRIAASGTYAGASASANAAKTAADKANADIINQINMANSQASTSTGEFNTEMGLNAALANRGNILDTIRGRTSLYGTTPALVNTFGNQVVQAGQLGQGQQGINNRRLETVGSLAGGW